MHYGPHLESSSRGVGRGSSSGRQGPSAAYGRAAGRGGQAAQHPAPNITSHFSCGCSASSGAARDDNPIYVLRKQSPGEGLGDGVRSAAASPLWPPAPPPAPPADRVGTIDAPGASTRKGHISACQSHKAVACFTRGCKGAARRQCPHLRDVALGAEHHPQRVLGGVIQRGRQRPGRLPLLGRQRRRCSRTIVGLREAADGVIAKRARQAPQPSNVNTRLVLHRTLMPQTGQQA